MDPVTIGAAISGGASLLGGMFGNSASAKAADKAFEQNLFAQREAQTWTNLQTSTAHQREVADLKAAGLNPILSGTGGMGSAAGSTGSAQATPAIKKDPITPALASAREAQLLGAQAFTEIQRGRIEKSKADAIEAVAEKAQPYISGGAKAIDDMIKGTGSKLYDAVTTPFKDIGMPDVQSLAADFMHKLEGLPQKVKDLAISSAASIGRDSRQYSSKSKPAPWANAKEPNSWRDVSKSWNRNNSTMGKPTGNKGRSFSKWE